MNEINTIIFNNARTFMYRNARPLELAEFQYHFENGSKDTVMNVLSYYQNQDGGFGHALEADCWNPNSIPLHSNNAGELICRIDYDDPAHPVIQNLLKWFTSGACFDGRTWAVAVPSNNDYPHAPWWHTDSESSCHTDYNGTASIAGFLVRYAEHDSEAFRLGVRIIHEAIEAVSQQELLDMHTCGCYIGIKDCVEKAGLTHIIPYENLKQRLRESVKRLIVTDTSRWGEYICKPSNFFDSKDSEYYADNAEIAEYECEYIMSTQLPDDSWPITWSWDSYPDEWAVSKNWWKGVGVINNLLYLKGFGKIG